VIQPIKFIQRNTSPWKLKVERMHDIINRNMKAIKYYINKKAIKYYINIYTPTNQ